MGPFRGMFLEKWSFLTKHSACHKTNNVSPYQTTTDCCGDGLKPKNDHYHLYLCPYKGRWEERGRPIQQGVCVAERIMRRSETRWLCQPSRLVRLRGLVPLTL